MSHLKERGREMNKKRRGSISVRACAHILLNVLKVAGRIARLRESHLPMLTPPTPTTVMMIPAVKHKASCHPVTHENSP